MQRQREAGRKGGRWKGMRRGGLTWLDGKKRAGGQDVGRGLGLGPHLRCDLVLVIMGKVLELSKDVFSSGEGFRPVASPLLPILPT